MTIRCAAVCAAFSVALCHCTIESGKKKPVKSGDMLTYSKDATELYEKGMKKFEGAGCVEAVKIFTQLKEKYPFSRYSQLADLRIADCDFDTEEYATASQRYKEFTQRYPSHKDVDYASFKRALATYKRIPGSSFIMPPVYEREQSFIKEAAREFREFLDDYPDSGHVEEAKGYYVKCLNLLADHELYVARFYYKKSKFKGAIHRCNRVIEKLKDSDMVPEAILLLGECYLKMKKEDQAVATFGFLMSKHSSSFQARQAEDYLKAMNKDPKKVLESAPVMEPEPVVEPGKEPQEAVEPEPGKEPAKEPEPGEAPDDEPDEDEPEAEDTED
ncbi:MAG: outer membrane protein assembly factor BamD [Pseudomonadota bacterium]